MRDVSRRYDAPASSISRHPPDAVRDTLRRILDAADGAQRDRFAVGSLHAKRYLIIDRDAKYSQQFRRLPEDSGTKVIRLPPMSPNLNAYAERFVRSIKDECLDRMIFVGQESLRRAVAEYMEHYHSERNHQV